MSSYSATSSSSPLIAAQRLHTTLRRLGSRLLPSRGLAFGLIILAGMIGFELFNYSTTEFALGDLLGQLHFAGVRWATILALAFCAIDFAGIARLLTPARGQSESAEVWYLLGAWFLAATMNAMLTWWGISLALLTHDSLGNEILGRETLLSSVPAFVAVLVWLIRVLMIGTLTLAGPRLFSVGTPAESSSRARSRSSSSSQATPAAMPQTMSRPIRPAPKPNGHRQPLAARPPEAP